MYAWYNANTSTRRIPSPLRRVKKGGKTFGNVRVSSLSYVEVRLVVIHHAFYPCAHCEAIVHRTSHPVLVPMTSAMGIFTRESLIPPWESSLHRPKIHTHTASRMYVSTCDPIRLHLSQLRYNAVLCIITWRSLKREENFSEIILAEVQNFIRQILKQTACNKN